MKIKKGKMIVTKAPNGLVYAKIRHDDGGFSHITRVPSRLRDIIHIPEEIKKNSEPRLNPRRVLNQNLGADDIFLGVEYQVCTWWLRDGNFGTIAEIEILG